MRRKPSRSLTSLRMRRAISWCLAERCAGSSRNQCRSRVDREVGDLADVAAVDPDRERLGLEAVAAAGLARRAAEILAQLLLEPGALGLAPAPLQVRQHALERPLGAVAAQAVVEAELDLLVARAVQDQRLHRLGQLLPRGVQAGAKVLRDAVQGLQIVRRGRVRPRLDRAVIQALLRVRHHQVRVHVQPAAEAVAGRAGAVRVVEREQARLDLLDREAGHRAGELGRQQQLLAGIRVVDHHEAVRMAERRLDALGEPLLEARRQHQAVDHQLDVVLDLLVELGDLIQLVQPAVDLDPLKALALELGQLLAVLALAAAHDRRQQVEPGTLGQGHDAIDHLRDRLALDRQAGGGRVGDADAGEQEAQIVVDLGDGADGRARVARGGLLLDRDRRRQAADRIDVGLLHQLEELARVGGQALDVAPLAVGVDGIERERALARA